MFEWIERMPNALRIVAGVLLIAVVLGGVWVISHLSQPQVMPVAPATTQSTQ